MWVVAHQLVKLMREPNNPYDCWAIRVDTIGNEKVGYLPRGTAAKVLSQVSVVACETVQVVVLVVGHVNEVGMVQGSAARNDHEAMSFCALFCSSIIQHSDAVSRQLVRLLRDARHMTCGAGGWSGGLWMAAVIWAGDKRQHQPIQHPRQGVLRHSNSPR